MKTNFLNTFSVFIILLLFTHCSQKPGTKNQVEIDLSNTHQVIDGFGSCIIGYKDYPEEYKDPGFYDMLINDLGMSIVRFPLNEHAEWRNDDNDPDHFEWNGFNLENMHRRPGLEQNVGFIMKNFKEHGMKRFMGTPWSPPQFMKTNRAPIQGGHLRADMVDELAEYLAATVMLAKKNYDIDINWISINNESIFIEFYRSCLYNGHMMREAVRATNRKFEELGINTRILINEDMMFPERIHHGLKPTMDDPETKDFNGHFAVHAKAGAEGLMKWQELSGPWDKKLWMTETSGHEPDFKGAMGMANTMHDYLVHGNISAWLYWQISGGTPEKGSRYAIMAAGRPTKKYYAAKHFYKFIRPGAKRLDVVSSDDQIKMSAYKHNAHGTVTIVAINDSDQDKTIGINIKGTQLPQTYEQFRTSETEDCELAGKLEKLESVSFPANSITTLIGNNDGLVTEEELQVQQAWSAPDGIKTGKWGNSEKLPFQTEWQRAADGDANLIDEAKKEGVDKTRANGWTILHDAILNGDGETVEYLLENGADINKPANDGWRPIHAAAATFVGNQHKNEKTKDYNKYDVFKLLIEAKPKLDVTTNDGWTPLHAAVTNSHTSYRAEEWEVLKKVKDLVAAGADMQAADINGRTALHWAAWQGYNHFIDGKLQVEADVVETLLELGANINAIDHTGNTPLHYAADMGYNEIVYTLVAAGANKSAINKDGKKPLDLARSKKLKNTVFILENNDYPPELKAYVNSKMKSAKEGPYGKVLLQAAWDGNVDEVQRLLKLGADLDYRDTDGLSAIDRAKANGHDEIVTLLEQAQAKKKNSNE